MPFGSAMAGSGSAVGSSSLACWSDAFLEGRGGIGGRSERVFQRIAIAKDAAAPAASMALPTSTFGQRRLRCRGGSSVRAVAASMAEILGATLSCTETLPRAALTAIQARTLPTLGLAQTAAPAAAFRVIGAAWSASFAACMAIFLARHCIWAAGMAGCFLVVTDTMSSPVDDPDQELPHPDMANRCSCG
jgi:hypothetical protein